MRSISESTRRLSRRCLAAAALAFLACGAASAQDFDYSYDDFGRISRARYDNGTVFDLDTDGGVNLTRKRVFEALGGGGGGGGGGGCFIATAAYGSALDPHVDELRGFRERWLRPYAPGRAFIAWYERSSPALASWIADRDWARAATRALLAPIVYGIAYPGPSLAAWILIAALAIRWRRARSRRRQLAATTAIL